MNWTYDYLIIVNVKSNSLSTQNSFLP